MIMIFKSSLRGYHEGMTSSSGRAGRTAIRRPGAGITIDRDRLVRLRQERRLSRAQLAEAMAGNGYTITPDAIAKIENGWRRPKPRTLDALCKALHCESTELLPSEGPEPDDEQEPGLDDEQLAAEPEQEIAS
jgi:transcriptional regulator with XRE-family HTH domain